jgi:hypothetical protein
MRKGGAVRWIDPRLMGSMGGDATRARDRIPPTHPKIRVITSPTSRSNLALINHIPLSHHLPQKTSQTQIRYLTRHIERSLVPGKHPSFLPSVRETTTRIRISLGGRVRLCSYPSFLDLIDLGGPLSTYTNLNFTASSLPGASSSDHLVHRNSHSNSGQTEAGSSKDGRDHARRDGRRHGSSARTRSSWSWTAATGEYECKVRLRFYPSSPLVLL